MSKLLIAAHIYRTFSFKTAQKLKKIDSILGSGWPWVRYFVMKIPERTIRVSALLALLLIIREELVVNVAIDGSLDSGDTARLQSM